MNRLAALATSTVASLVALSGAAMADAGKAPAGWYVSGGVGYNMVDDLSNEGTTVDLDDGYAIQGAIGYDTGDITSYGKFRAEAEVGYSENENDTISGGGLSLSADGELKQTTVMVNAFVDFIPGAIWRPYVGVGVGYVDSKVSASAGGMSDSEDTSEFAYRGLAGLSYHINSTWALDLGYRYTAYDTDGADVDNHAIVTGIRYGF